MKVLFFVIIVFFNPATGDNAPVGTMSAEYMENITECEKQAKEFNDLNITIELLEGTKLIQKAGCILEV